MKFISYILYILIYTSYAFSHTVIINSENTDTVLDKMAIKDIFNGDTLSWDDGSNIFVADYTANSEIRKSFSKLFLGLPPEKVYLNWIRISLSGKGAPPKIFHSEDEVIRFVEENPNAIGYIEKVPTVGSKSLKIVFTEK